MRTVNISYVYLEGDTVGSRHSNIVRCITYIALTMLPMGDAAGFEGGQQLMARDSRSRSFKHVQVEHGFLEGSNIMETGKLNAITLA